MPCKKFALNTSELSLLRKLTDFAFAVPCILITLSIHVLLPSPHPLDYSLKASFLQEALSKHLRQPQPRLGTLPWGFPSPCPCDTEPAPLTRECPFTCMVPL